MAEEIKDWRDPDYDNTASLIAGTATGRKPNMREMMEAMAGMPVEEIYATMPQEQWSTLSRAASGMLYGDTGQSVSDTNWETFMDDPSTRKSLRDAGDYLLSSEVKNIKRSRERQDVIDNVRDSITSRLPGSPRRPAVVTERPTSPNYLTEEDSLTVTKPGVRSPDEIIPIPRGVVPTPVQPAPVTPTQSQTGTISQPLQTSTLSAVPEQVTYKTQYTGTADNIPQTLVSTVPGQNITYDPNQIGYQNVYYSNPLGQRIMVSEFNGQPTTYVPEGFTKEVTAARGGYINKYASGGSVVTDAELEGKYRIYTKQFGYNGPKTREAIKQFEDARPEVKRKGMAIGGYVRSFNDGGYVRIYDPISGKNLTESQIQNRITSPNLGSPYADAGITSVEDLKNYNPNSTTTQTPTTTPTKKTPTNDGGYVRIYDPISGKNLTESQIQNRITSPNLGGPYAEAGITSLEDLKNYNPNSTTTETPTTTTQTPTTTTPTTETPTTTTTTGEETTTTAPDFTGMTSDELKEMQANLVKQTMQPVQSTVSQIQPTAADFIPSDAGITTPVAPFAEAATVGTVQQATMPTATPASTVEAVTAEDKVRAETEATKAAQGEVSAEAQVEAAQQTESAVSGLEAAQGEAYLIDSPVQRELQEGELIDVGATAGQAEKAAKFTEQIQAATATPSEKATVQGQLESLMQDFEGGDTPAWAAGALRAATAAMAARGLGASSMAGQAAVQAAMESALPIAQADAATQASFEAQNLSNRQQRAMLAAEQRAKFMGQEFDQAFQTRVINASKISDIANMNFTAEQQVQLENARAANTMNLANLNNKQAMVMAEAAALANLDMANLSNRQAAAVQNAQSFLQMDMANLSNEQQTAMFKAQSNIQALFTDQAAENAAAQFNASSENQTNQFFANLQSQTSQFNATQQNAMDQFNVNSVNALREFNSGLQQQRDMFNAQNGLVIAQANAQWRQNIATINTAAQNQSNMDFAKTINALTASNMDQIWQRERDIMSFAFAAAESGADRAANIALAKLTADEQAKLQDSIGKGKLAAIAVDAFLGKWLK